MFTKTLKTGLILALAACTLSACPGRNDGRYGTVIQGKPVGWIYTTLYATNAVMEIDNLQSRVKSQPILVPGGPRALAIDPRGSSFFLYVVCQLGNAVSIVDRRSRTITRTISVGRRPFAIAITPNGERAFVTNEDDDTVTEIDVNTQSVRATHQLSTFVGQTPGQGTTQPGQSQLRLRPQGIATNGNGTRVYVACASGQVIVLEGSPTSSYTASRNIVLNGAVRPLNIAVSPETANEQVFITDPQANRLWYFSANEQGQQAQSIDISGSPTGLAIGKNPGSGRVDRLYVTAAAGTSGALYPLTLPNLSGATGGGVSVEGKEPTAVAVSPQGDEVFVSLSGSNTVTVFKRVGDNLARPEAYQYQQMESQYIAPTGDLALGGYLF